MNKFPISCHLKAFNLDLAGEAFAFARNNHRLSQQELADLAGVRQMFIQRSETGSHDYSVSRFIAICFALGLPPGDVIQYAVTLPSLAPETIKSEIGRHFPSLLDCEQQYERASAVLQRIAHLALTCIWFKVNPNRVDFHSERLRDGFISFCAFTYSDVERVRFSSLILKSPLSVMLRYDLLPHDPDALLSELTAQLPEQSLVPPLPDSLQACLNEQHSLNRKTLSHGEAAFHRPPGETIPYSGLPAI